MKKALVLLLACAPALAQDAKDWRAAQDAEKTALPAEPRRQLVETVRRLADRIPPTKKLVPRTTGMVKLAILLVELADCPRPAWPKQAWQEMLFSRKTYAKDPDGRPTFGSVRDFYAEQSGGKLDLDGKVFDWVAIAAKRSEIEGSYWYSVRAKRAVLNAAVDKLLAREGEHALDDVDALGFVVSGPQAKEYGSVLWPHSEAFFHKDKFWRYYLMHAGSEHFEPIGTHAHEIGHVLGLPDEYGVGAHSGSGIYCLMSIGNAGGYDNAVPSDEPPLATEDAVRAVIEDELHKLVHRLLGKLRKPKPTPPATTPPPPRTTPPPKKDLMPFAGARPLHICAPCKAALGWIEPIPVKRGQQIFLEAVEDHPDDVVAIELPKKRRLLLEYRGRKGFDANLPRTGLLAWRTGDLVGSLRRTLALGANGELVPAHGLASVDGAHREGVLFPYKEHTSFTVDGVTIDGIVEKDGRVYFAIR